jgi:hypothetical protein
LALQEYDFEIKHVAGTRNPSDYCSCYPLPQVDEEAGKEILEQLFSAMVILETYKTLDYESELKEIYACLTRVVMVMVILVSTVLGVFCIKIIGGLVSLMK